MNVIPHPSNKGGRPIEYIIENGCWICTSHKADKDGYPRIHLEYKHRRMSHIVYKYFTGEEVVKPNIILHSCDNPKCINPKHLRVGTLKENGEDKSIRRRIHGERNPKAKLTKEQVEYIRTKVESATELSKKYGVSRTQIYNIQKGKSWI